MNTLDEIYAAQDRWDKALDNAQRRQEAAKKRIDQAYKHLGTYTMVSQIATALTPRFAPCYALNVLGPFGLTNETSIHAVDVAAGRTMGSLSFRPTGMGERRLVLVDRRHVTEKFPAGSLGDYNGMNYAEVALPEDGLDGLARLLLASIDEGARQ